MKLSMPCVHLLLVIVISLHFSSGQRIPSDVATTEYGQLQGFTISTKEGIEADVFLGVPFARPPVGDLRFEVMPYSVNGYKSFYNPTLL